MKHSKRRRRISRNFKVHRQYRTHAARTHETAAKNSSCDRAGAHTHHPLAIRHGLIGFEQRSSHVFTHGAYDEEKICSAWRRGEKIAKAVHVVERIVELLDFMKAGATITSIHYHHMQRLGTKPIPSFVTHLEMQGTRIDEAQAIHVTSFTRTSSRLIESDTIDPLSTLPLQGSTH
jgi:hypothetical protein